MKKFLSLLGFLLLATFGFAQVPAATIVPGPYASDAWTFSNAATGRITPLTLAFSANGNCYAVFDPSVNPVEFIAAANYLQTPQGSLEVRGQKVFPIVSAGTVNMSIGTQIYRTVQDWVLTSNTVLTTIPGLQATLQTNCNYMFRAVLYTTIGAGGSKVDFGGTAVPVSQSVMGQVTALAATTITYTAQPTSFLGGGYGATTASVTQIIIEGTFQVNTGGTFVIQFAQNGSSVAASTVRYGSTLTVTQIP